MIIEIARLARGEQDLEGECPSSILEIPVDQEDVTVDSPVRYALVASLIGSELLVTGQLEVAVTLVCGRCGCRFPFMVREGAFVVNREIVDFTAHVDLTEEAREATLLAFPTHPLCGKACRGLCAQCGVNLNERVCACKPSGDARWNNLDQITLN
jgi:uncharacterized protein